MRKLLLVAAVAVMVPSFADNSDVSAPVAKDGENKDAKGVVYPVHPSKMAEYNAKTGGLVPPPAFAKALLFLDARPTNVPDLSKWTGPAERMLSIAIDTQRATLSAAENPQKVAFAAKKDKAGAVVLLYERSGDPTLTAFLEDGIVLVNLEPLKCDDANQFSRRFSTEFWRSIGFALGAYASTTQMGSSMQALYSLDDFNALKGAGLAPMQVAAISANKSKLGIFSRESVPYSRACREGWAPPPTNDVQRSFYNRFVNPAARFQEDFKKK